MKSSGPIFLTGSTGFVGGHLWQALQDSGEAIRCLTRNAERARTRWPDRDWVQGDVADREGMVRALDSCRTAYYLVHGMAEGGGDFRRKEVEAARAFRDAASDAGVERVIYLGGVAPPPDCKPSEHLRSRLEVGEELRQGGVPTVELRASMIIGCGSQSWMIVRDLAARLPMMVLPRWLHSRTQPIAIQDVITALVEAARMSVDASDSYDIPGPEILSGREILERTTRILGMVRPWIIEAPVLSPWLSSHWVRLVTRADWSVAREIVLGLTGDLLARDARFWDRIGHRSLLSFDEAARRAIGEESPEPHPSGVWQSIERGRRRRH